MTEEYLEDIQKDYWNAIERMNGPRNNHLGYQVSDNVWTYGPTVANYEKHVPLLLKHIEELRGVLRDTLGDLDVFDESVDQYSYTFRVVAHARDALGMAHEWNEESGSWQ